MLRSLEYLSHRISGEGLRPSESKIKTIVQAPVPENVQELQSFLGMITYYCKFIPHFSTILSPLYDLLKENVEFHYYSKNSFSQI